MPLHTSKTVGICTHSDDYAMYNTVLLYRDRRPAPPVCVGFQTLVSAGGGGRRRAGFSAAPRGPGGAVRAALPAPAGGGARGSDGRGARWAPGGAAVRGEHLQQLPGALDFRRPLVNMHVMPHLTIAFLPHAMPLRYSALACRSWWFHPAAAPPGPRRPCPRPAGRWRSWRRSRAWRP